MNKYIFLLASCIATLALCLPASAEVKFIEAESTYVIGDNDSKVDARRIAILEAKRKALESAGTYVESLSQVKNFQLTGDDIRSYAAAVLETEIVTEQMRGTTAKPELYIKARCKIDSDALATKLAKLRDFEDMKEQFNAAAKENEQLKKERDALLKQLALEKDKTRADFTRQKLNTILTKEEANDETRRVWAAMGPSLLHPDEYAVQIKKSDLDASSVVLQQALKNNPQNPNARLMLASIYQRQGNSSAAEQELRTAIQRNPSNLALHMRLGILFLEQKRYPDALKEFKFVERLRPRNLTVLYYIGATFKAMDKCGRSVQYLNRFLKDPRVKHFPQKRDSAIATIEECGGSRPGRVKRVKFQ
ncbi:MAG: tetratricopeptide repeat protein [Nitrospirota bacterium]